MPTGAKKGLNPARKIGSGPDNQGLSTYTIESGYGTALGKGDPVRLASGFITKAANNADSIGVFMGVKYVDSQGNIRFSNYWPASTVATEIEALIIDNTDATFHVVGESSVSAVVPGQYYALNLTAADALTGQSTVDVDISTGATAANAGLVRVISVVDATNNVLEVSLLNSDLRVNG